jgi:hypothetical protein
MTISFPLILMLLAFVVLALAALNVATARVNLLALGLALWVLATLVR